MARGSASSGRRRCPRTARSAVPISGRCSSPPARPSTRCGSRHRDGRTPGTVSAQGDDGSPAAMINFGTFLLMQSPSARSSQEIYARGIEIGRARWEESIDILLKTFEGRPFSYDGKLFKIPETTVFPQTLQQPRPPIWITAQSPESIEAAVRRGFNVLTGGFGVPIERMA